MATTTSTQEATRELKVDEFEGHDAEQIRLMEETLIVVDYDDNVVGDGSKKECASARLALRRLSCT